MTDKSNETEINQPEKKTPPENAVWLTSKEAADYLRMSADALRTAVCRGQLTSFKWRRRLYFKRIELDRMLEMSRHRSQYGHTELSHSPLYRTRRRRTDWMK